MDSEILAALIGVSAAFIGSIVGGVLSYLSTRSVRKIEWKLERRDRETERRYSLYAEFLAEASRLMLLSFERKGVISEEVRKLVALESQIWFHSTEVGASSRNIASCVLNHFEKDEEEDRPNFPELRDEYVRICRRDLDRL
ncbi:hypothetical protein [Salinisphaera sp. C84B14]|uniref:hypothetical protein n=1 Tax=Salinisphaera sp. C84B14 TaxID=1304155 RepID=UPI00333E3A95